MNHDDQDYEDASGFLNDFKKWMQNQTDPNKNPIIGTIVESRISSKKLFTKINPEEGDLEDLVEDFKIDGGTIVGIDGHSFLVEVYSGKFFIDRTYLRKVS